MGKLTRSVPIVLEYNEDGTPERTRYLCYTLGALAKFEDKYDKSLGEMFAPTLDANGKPMLNEDGEEINLSFRLGMVIDLVWVGLLKDDPTLDREYVANVLDMNNIPEIMPLTLEAIGFSNAAAFPAKKEATPKKSRQRRT